MSKTLIIGDMHLGKGLSLGKASVGNSYNSRVNDQVKILNWILELISDRNINRVILTGDIFEDTRPEYYLTEIFIGWIKAINMMNVDTHIIMGNHDIFRSGKMIISPILDIVSKVDFENVSVHRNITSIVDEGHSFTFMPFRDRRGMECDTATEALQKLDSVIKFESHCLPKNVKKVLVGHLAIEGAIYVGDEYNDNLNELMCPLDMFSTFDYTIMGHVHRPQVKSKKPHISHIGSLDTSDYGETDHKKILIIFDSEKEDFEKITVPSRPLRILRLELSNEKLDPTDFVIENINSQHNGGMNYKDSIVKLEIRITNPSISSVDLEKVKQHIYSLGAFHISSISESRNFASKKVVSEEEIENTINPKIAIKLYADIIDLEDEEKSDFIDVCNQIVEDN